MSAACMLICSMYDIHMLICSMHVMGEWLPGAGPACAVSVHRVNSNPVLPFARDSAFLRVGRGWKAPGAM